MAPKQFEIDGGECGPLHFPEPALCEDHVLPSFSLNFLGDAELTVKH